ncbi:MAG: MFS transporter [Chitinivibrionales bacterium]|nr:MFS transporter [Chitinivibrionales bacterium]MBD3358625.1 MFS transporter [Chitinivibrionales bacterium]
MLPKLLSSNFPHRPDRYPFFYGYVIVAASAVGTIMSAPGQTIGVAVFTDHLIENLGIGRFHLSVAYMAGTIGSSLLIGRTGRLIDSVGARSVATATALLLGIVLVGMSRVDLVAHEVNNFLGERFPVITAFVTVMIGFLAMRFLGQGVLTLASRTMLMRWFDVKRGRMSAIVGICVALTFSGSPLVFESLIRLFGWRGAWAAMGVVLSIVAVTIIYTFFRDTPECCGLVPDGHSNKKKTEEISKDGDAEVERDWTAEQAKTTFTFWVFNFGLCMFSMVATAISFHIVSIFETEGLTRQAAISIFLPGSIIAVTVNAGAGWLSDWRPFRYRLNILLAGLLLGVLLMCVGVYTLGAGWGRYVIIVGNGLASGLFGNLTAVAWPRFFGRTHLGAISGINMAFLVFSSAVGPPLFAWSYSLTQTYEWAVFICASLAILFMALSVRAGKPTPRDADVVPATKGIE